MRVCPSCTSAVVEGSRFCSGCGLSVTPFGLTQTSLPAEVAFAVGGSRPPTHGAGRIVAKTLPGDIRFLPGDRVAARYRIVGLIGAGGMGEVYRADDVKLGQPVALKFLPEALNSDENRLRRFLHEVKTARQVSHANVCRVYDVGEFEGLHYLSMEFVDGEDLASLLRRIGRLEHEKAVEIARQICAGLAAAHARGIVHRDLKPANVMIDGRGHVRITDFGLAGLAEGITGAEIRAGTPDYMAPEQLAGREVSVRSDLYALGLVLYEMFTGKPAFRADTLVELRHLVQTETPRSPSTLVGSIDPAVERVILRCLEKDPGQRPTSALAVAAALPGGDPLAAALAAGETPSPEMVASAGVLGGLRPRTAVAALLLFFAGLAGALALADSMLMTGHLALKKSPETLLVESGMMLERLGYPGAPEDRTGGFSIDRDYIKHVETTEFTPTRWSKLATVRPSPARYWYRQSPQPLVPVGYSGGVTLANPPSTRSGMISLELDPQGRLLQLLVVPPEREDDAGPPAEPDWPALFREAGLDERAFHEVAPRWNPLVTTDRSTAWEGTYAGQPGVPIRVEAGAYRGKPVHFAVIAPWTRASRMDPPDADAGSKAANVMLILLLILFIGAGSFVAVRNLRLGRTDRRGAFRMALYLVSVALVGWALTTHHTASFGEVGLWFEALEGVLFIGGLVWVVYLALEPYVRKLWPQALVSWTRLLAGRPCDPLVGRDVLLGSLAGVLLALLVALMQLGPQWIGQRANTPAMSNALGSLRRTLGAVFAVQIGSLFTPIALLFLILMLRVLLKRQWAAFAATLVFVMALIVLQNDPSWVIWVLALVFWVLVILMTTRLGMLASIVAFFVTNLVWALPLTLDTSAWYAPAGWIALLAPLCLAVWGFYVSLAGRSLFADPLG